MLEEYDPENPPFLLQYKVEDFFTLPEEFDFEIRGVEYSVHLARYKHRIVEPFPFLEGANETRRNILKVVVEKDHQAEALVMCFRFVFKYHLDLWLDAVSYIEERVVEKGEHKTEADPESFFRDIRYFEAVYARFVSTLFNSKLTHHINQQLQTVKKPEDVTVHQWVLWFRSVCTIIKYLPKGKVICKDLLDTKQRSLLLFQTFPESWCKEYERLGPHVLELGCAHMMEFMMKEESHQLLLDRIRQRFQAKISLKRQQLDNNKPSPRRIMVAYRNRATIIFTTTRSSQTFKSHLINNRTNSSSRLLHHSTTKSSLWSDDPEPTTENTSCYKSSMSPTDTAIHGTPANSPARNPRSGVKKEVAVARTTIISSAPHLQKSGESRKADADTPNTASVPPSSLLDTKIFIPGKSSLPKDNNNGKLTESLHKKRPVDDSSSSNDDNHEIRLVVRPKKKKKRKLCLLHGCCGHSSKECRDIKFCLVHKFCAHSSNECRYLQRLVKGKLAKKKTKKKKRAVG